LYYYPPDHPPALRTTSTPLPLHPATPGRPCYAETTSRRRTPILRSTPVNGSAPRVTVQEPDADPNCCVFGRGDHGVRGRGDDRAFPTRV